MISLRKLEIGTIEVKLYKNFALFVMQLHVNAQWAQQTASFLVEYRWFNGSKSSLLDDKHILLSSTNKFRRSADPKGSTFVLLWVIHFWLTDPNIFRKALLAPLYTNFEGKARRKNAIWVYIKKKNPLPPSPRFAPASVCYQKTSISNTSIELSEFFLTESQLTGVCIHSFFLISNGWKFCVSE